MRVIFRVKEDDTPYLIEAANMVWCPDEGSSAKQGGGTLEIEEMGSEAIWELHHEELADGEYERYMKEALTRGYVDLTKLPPFTLQGDEKEELIID